MTREEIIKHLHEALNFVDITFPYRYVFVEAIEALSQPSLPSNVDDAAEKYANLRNWAYETVFYAFKAGAKWMARQGATVDGVLKAGDPGYPDVHMGEQYSIEYILRKPDGIEPGDEVVVQIRKK